MFSHPCTIAAALFTAGMLAYAPAHAGQGKATASLSNIQFELIDLDLTDNITPSITFSRKSASESVLIRSGSDNAQGSSSGFKSISRSVPDATVSASATPTSVQVGAQADVVEANLNATATASQTMSFVLSPSTRLSFSAQADTVLDNEGIMLAWSSATLGASMDMLINGVVGNETVSMTLRNTKGERSRFLFGSMDTGASIGRGTLTASTTARFINSLSMAPLASPVPEPASYAMLAAGLLVIGAARRKARQA
ncbi:PEP-CTERM sorting domain-containing protein [Massilia genomosp. 1]|uniref:PEP-CTERM sorting domain-containing protein n=1 Tax=Massilia genomosp. 1 TaxID=2609280 RepID=A0ABX0MQL5_9BURK|nr:PEP-CTERM sorting domain-containing protein [Massilia genomosp. 1]NHZ62788.1 PEP-CTERM sorting domain-containing protein [Massilia genomosp. 1]